MSFRNHLTGCKYRSRDGKNMPDAWRTSDGQGHSLRKTQVRVIDAVFLMEQTINELSDFLDSQGASEAAVKVYGVVVACACDTKGCWACSCDRDGFTLVKSSKARQHEQCLPRRFPGFLMLSQFAEGHAFKFRKSVFRVSAGDPSEPGVVVIERHVPFSGQREFFVDNRNQTVKDFTGGGKALIEAIHAISQDGAAWMWHTAEASAKSNREQLKPSREEFMKCDLYRYANLKQEDVEKISRSTFIMKNSDETDENGLPAVIQKLNQFSVVIAHPIQMLKASKKCEPKHWPTKTIKRIIADEGDQAAHETSQCRCRCKEGKYGSALSDGKMHSQLCTPECEECPASCNQKKANFFKALDLFPDAFVFLYSATTERQDVIGKPLLPPPFVVVSHLDLLREGSNKMLRMTHLEFNTWSAESSPAVIDAGTDVNDSDEPAFSTPGRAVGPPGERRFAVVGHVDCVAAPNKKRELLTYTDEAKRDLFWADDDTTRNQFVKVLLAQWFKLRAQTRMPGQMLVFVNSNEQLRKAQQSFSKLLDQHPHLDQEASALGRLPDGECGDHAP